MTLGKGGARRCLFESLGVCNGCLDRRELQAARKRVSMAYNVGGQLPIRE